MIKSKTDLKLYLETDRIALGRPVRTLRVWLKELIFPDRVWRFQRVMRKFEYYANVRKSLIYSPCLIYLKLKYRKISRQLGFTIPINTFGKGLAIAHYGTIVINGNAKIGENCRIHPCTNIGASGGSYKAPIIGNNVYIAPGVKIYGDITIANNIAFAANAAVGKSFVEENSLVGGVPAVKIKAIDISTLIKHIR